MQTFSSKGATVRVDLSAIERVIERLERRAARLAAERLEQHAARVLTDAKAGWGVDSGRGRSSLRLVVEAQRTKFRVAIVSDNPRVRFQRPRRSRITYFERLVVRPLRALSQRLAADVARQIAKDAGGG